MGRLGANTKGTNELNGFLFFGSNHERNKQAFNAAPDDKVTVFFDAGFNGKSMSFAPGAFKLFGTAKRDEISSIKVPDGLTLEIWTGGPPSHPDLGPGSNPRKKRVFKKSVAYVGDELNDKIDTIRVSGTPAGSGSSFKFEKTTEENNSDSTTTEEQQPSTTDTSTGNQQTTQSPAPTQRANKPLFGNNAFTYSLVGVSAVTVIGSVFLLSN